MTLQLAYDFQECIVHFQKKKKIDGDVVQNKVDDLCQQWHRFVLFAYAHRHTQMSLCTHRDMHTIGSSEHCW